MNTRQIIAAQDHACRRSPRWRTGMLILALLSLTLQGRALAIDDQPVDAGQYSSDVTGDGITESQARLRIAAVVGTIALGVGAYGMNNWWESGFSGTFRTVDEGWFGKDTEYGGTDKLGHMYSNYLGTRLLSWLYEGLLHDRERAQKLGLITTLGTFAAVEIVDGFSNEWRFSKEDLLADIAGATLGYLVERNPEWDEKFDFRLHYRRSSQEGEQKASWDPLADYSGQTYVIAVKASGFESLRDRSVLRYLEAAVGYNARGFDSVDGVRTGDPERHLYFGVSLNLSQILNDTVFEKQRGSRTQRISDGILEFVQVPGTAAVVDHQF